MDINHIFTVIETVAKEYADARLNLFQVEVAGLDRDSIRLRGRVLEAANLQRLIEALHSKYPDFQVDASAVEILRKGSPRMLAVGTNLTSMHNGTSFLAEMATQMVNGTPVEILWEEGRWAFARQVDGYLGWTYVPYLTDQALPQPSTHLVCEPVTLLRSSPQGDAPILTRVLAGTALQVTQSQGAWARAALAGGWKGWLPAESLRALESLPQTARARQERLAADAPAFTGVPYLWGGNSANGIDCSGYAQLLHRLVGITIPRDADMQFTAGQPVEPPFAVGDLLFFGEQGEQRHITHVGVSLGGWKMIHSSRRQNGVQVDDVQQVESLKSIYLCAATYINC